MMKALCVNDSAGTHMMDGPVRRRAGDNDHKDARGKLYTGIFKQHNS